MLLGGLCTGKYENWHFSRVLCLCYTHIYIHNYNIHNSPAYEITHKYTRTHTPYTRLRNLLTRTKLTHAYTTSTPHHVIIVWHILDTLYELLGNHRLFKCIKIRNS